jgi:hypothetical protein
MTRSPEERTCSVDGCDRPVLARGLCSPHYTEARRESAPACKSCDRPADARGFCGPCYRRARSTGQLKRQNVSSGGACTVSGCDRPAQIRRHCRSHYARIWRTGSAEPADRRRSWTAGDDCSIKTAHLRIRSARGVARDRPCVDCGGPAAHWSYCYTAGDRERIDPKTGSAYSPDPAHYSPRCIPCHRNFDDRLSPNPNRLRLVGPAPLALADPPTPQTTHAPITDERN